MFFTSLVSVCLRTPRETGLLSVWGDTKHLSVSWRSPVLWVKRSRLPGGSPDNGRTLRLLFFCCTSLSHLLYICCQAWKRRKRILKMERINKTVRTLSFLLRAAQEHQKKGTFIKSFIVFTSQLWILTWKMSFKGFIAVKKFVNLLIVG